MPNFPKSEAEVIRLAQSIIRGMQENPDFPSSPVSTSDLQNSLDEFFSARDAKVAAHAAAEQATDVKQTKYEAMITRMKTMLRYAEDAVHGDDAKLSALDWGARRARTPLAAPGQARLLEVTQQGAGSLTLRWKKPMEGGTVANYTIERRERAEGDWELTGTVNKTEATLTNQERGKEWEYHVIAVNRVGEGLPSNSVTAVL